MKDNKYSLQFLHHGEVFATRDDAMDYLKEEFKNKALLAEPAVVFYGNANKPDVIFAIGSGERQIFTVDSTAIQESINASSSELGETIESISSEVAENQEAIAKLTSSLKNAVEECGLVWDENKIVNQISYTPDATDVLLHNAENLAEAIALISTYVQEQFKAVNLSTEDTKTITLTFEDNPHGGKTVKAQVNVSTYGEDDEIALNDNIIGIKNDGIFAAANLEYDEEKNELTFTTSGMRNGRFVDDANKKVIKFGEHTKYVADNENHTVEVVVDENKKTISADIKVSENSNNILVKQDGKLFVDGRAANIKYKSGTVFSGINALENSVNEIKSNIEKINDTYFVEGDESDTLNIVASKQVLGNYKVSGNVRLGSKNTIKIANGGLEADVNVDFDALANKLIFRIGDETKEIVLNGVDLVQEIYYDSNHKKIVVVTKAGNLEVAIDDLFKDWEVDNAPLSPIVLSKHVSASAQTPDKLSASLKLAVGNNILEVDSNGNLIAKESKITDAVAAEKNRAEASENEIKQSLSEAEANINEHILEATSRISGIANDVANETTRATNAESALEREINLAKTEIGEVKQNVTNVQSDLTALSNRVLTAENNIVTNSSAIEAVQTTVADHDSKINNLVTESSVNTTKVGELRNDLNQAVADLQGKDTVLEGKINDNTAAVTSEVNRAKGVEEEIKLNVESISGSVIALSQKIDHSVEDLNSSIATKEEHLKEKDTDLQGQIDTLRTAIGSGSDSALTEAKAYTDNEVGKIDTKFTNAIDIAKRDVTDAASADATAKSNQALADAKAYTDAEKERAIAAEQANATEIVNIKAKDIETDSKLALKVEEVTIQKNSTNDLQYTLLVDGVPSGEINIPKDQFLKSVEYNATSKEIEFVFETSEGAKVTKVNIADLVDTYKAGNGLSLDSDNNFSIKKSAASESYLSVDENGVAITGINAALLTKANANDVYTKTESDGKFLTEHQDITNLATKEEVENAKADISVLNGKVVDNTAAIAVINGNEAEEGSIKKALKDAKTYADAKDTEAMENVYTKSEIDNKGYLVNADIENFVEKDAFNDKVAELQAKDASIDVELAKKIEKVEIVKNSASDLQYILKVNNVDAGEINIPKDQFLKDVTYSEAEKSLHFKFVTETGEVETVINIADLVDTYVAGKGINLEGNKFSVVISEGSESYLTVTDGGVSINGINDALAAKANVGDAYTKAEADAKFITEHQDITALATNAEVAEAKADINALNGKVTDIEAKIAVINGNEAEEGSILKALKDAKAYADAKDADIEDVLDKKVGKVEIVKNSASDLQYILKVDGVDAGEINIPKDQFLKEVAYSDAEKSLRFKFSTESGEVESVINISDLVDTYVAGNGLKLEGNKFSVTVSEGSEAYLTVTGSGISINGINDALAAKANVGDAYTKAEADAKFLTEYQDLTALQDKVAENEAKIAIINGNEAENGSVKKALADAKAYTDDKVAVKANADDVYTKTEADSKFLTEHQDITALEARVAANETSINVINGNEAEVGSVLNAIKVAKEYTNEKDAEIIASIADKANAADVYTKGEADTKFLVEHQDISGLATKAKVDEEIERAKSSEAEIKTIANGNTAAITDEVSRATTAENALRGQILQEVTDRTLAISGLSNQHAIDIANATNAVDTEKNRAIAAEEALGVRIDNLPDNSFAANNSDTVNLTLAGNAGNKTLQAEVKIDVENTNIIKKGNGGIYANVTWTYNAATNTVVFNNGNGEVEYHLSDASLVQDARYDSVNKKIVLVVVNNGETRTIDIPVDDFIRTVDVENVVDSPVHLTKTADGDVDVLKVELAISDDEDNLLTPGSRSLFASRHADKHYAHWAGESDITVQVAIDRLKTETDKIGAIKSDVEGLNARMTAVEGEVSVIRATANQVTNDMTNVLRRMNEVETTVGTYDALIQTLTLQFAQVKTLVEGMDARMSSIETSVAEVNRQLTDTTDTSTIASRLNRVEYEVDNMVDFNADEEEW